jgi:hypothetical protein
MNDGKSIIDAETPKTDALLGGQAPSIQAVRPDGPDLRRRRLLRGAAGIAPVVITLRSGALAASSCVNTKAVVVTDNTGNFSSAESLAIGDKCVVAYGNTDCTIPSIDSKAVTPGATKIGNVTTAASPNFTCSGITPSSPGTTTVNVAIISSSITSFGV